MKRYEAYDSFLDIWADEIPAHWETHKMKYLFHERSEKGYPDEPLLVASQNMGVVPKNVYGNRTVEAQKDLHLLKLVRVGDFVISLRSFQGGLEYAYYQGIISPAYTVLTPHEPITAGYFRYLAKSKLFIGLLTLCVTGIREGQNIDYEKLRNHFLPVPPREEQDQIVRYLDWQVSKINRLIAAKRKQIALLREQIQQTITDIVYHGINQTVNYQSVKMLYVDKIPAHWECKRGKFLFAEHDIRSMDGKEELLSVSHITGVTPRSQKNITMFKSESLVNYKICRKDDIAANTMWIWQGAIAVSSYHGVVSPSYSTYHQIGNVYDSAYLDYMLRSKPLVDEYYVRSTGIRKSRLRLYPEQLLDMFFPVPPMEEQKLIAAVITEKTQAVNHFIAAIEKQIDRINELRLRLISDVVTGQVDVRGIEVPEFEYVGEADVAGEQDEEETEEEVDG